MKGVLFAELFDIEIQPGFESDIGADGSYQ